MTAAVVVLVAAAACAAWWWRRATREGRSSELPGVVVRVRPVLPRGPLPPPTQVRTGGVTYRFSFVAMPDGRCRAYIVDQPGYGTRSASMLATHRLRDAAGRPYVCFSPEPRSPGQLATVVGWWIRGTEAYRRTGAFVAPRA